MPAAPAQRLTWSRSSRTSVSGAAGRRLLVDRSSVRYLARDAETAPDVRTGILGKCVDQVGLVDTDISSGALVDVATKRRLRLLVSLDIEDTPGEGTFDDSAQEERRCHAKRFKHLRRVEWEVCSRGVLEAERC